MPVPSFARKAENEQDVKWLDQFHPLQILDCIPENKYLSKDSGRWLIHDDNDEIVMEQKGSETLPDFLKRYALSILQGDNDAERETLCTNLATINLWKEINKKS